MVFGGASVGAYSLCGWYGITLGSAALALAALGGTFAPGTAVVHEPPTLEEEEAAAVAPSPKNSPKKTTRGPSSSPRRGAVRSAVCSGHFVTHACTAFNIGFGFTGTLSIVPVVLVTEFGWSPERISLAMLSLSLPNAAAAFAAPTLSRRLGLQGLTLRESLEIHSRATPNRKTCTDEPRDVSSVSVGHLTNSVVLQTGASAPRVVSFVLRFSTNSATPSELSGLASSFSREPQESDRESPALSPGASGGSFQTFYTKRHAQAPPRSRSPPTGTGVARPSDSSRSPPSSSSPTPRPRPRRVFSIVSKSCSGRCRFSVFSQQVSNNSRVKAIGLHLTARARARRRRKAPDGYKDRTKIAHALSRLTSRERTLARERERERRAGTLSSECVLRPRSTSRKREEKQNALSLSLERVFSVKGGTVLGRRHWPAHRYLALRLLPRLSSFGSSFGAPAPLSFLSP